MASNVFSSYPYKISPAGDRVAYLGLDQSVRGAKLMVAPLKPDASDVDNPVEVAGPDIRARTPTWSPDGERLLFLGYPSQDGHELYIADLGDGSLTSIGIVDGGPALWSPDGSQIAIRSRTLSGKLTIFTMKPDGSDLLVVTPDLPEHVRQFVWSPNGRQLLFLTSELHESWLNNHALWLVNRDGSNRTLLAELHSTKETAI